ncbi:MAG: hypothetical protein JEZ08_12630 [Clostridiales bacterium]|nr:hypothetical protein [Clostridiales bacterium]
MLASKSKFKVVLLLVLVGLISFLSLNHWSADYNKKIDCIRYRLGENNYENVVVHLEGSINRSLLLKDYISYTLYIDGVRHPDKNHLLMPYNKRQIGPNRVYDTNFNPVKEIQTSYVQYPQNKSFFIEYKYWIDNLDISNQRYLDLGIFFFEDFSFNDIIIGLHNYEGNEKTYWTNKVGYEVIVSGNNMDAARTTLDQLNMKVFDENDEVVD